MNKDMQKTVGSLSEEIAESIGNDFDERPRLALSDSDNMNAVATLEIARQLALLTDQVRAMVVMQADAMAMAKEVMAKFKEEHP